MKEKFNLELNEMLFQVEVLETREIFGRKESLVRPVAGGKIKKWVSSKRLKKIK